MSVKCRGNCGRAQRNSWAAHQECDYMKIEELLYMEIFILSKSFDAVIEPRAVLLSRVSSYRK